MLKLLLALTSSSSDKLPQWIPRLNLLEWMAYALLYTRFQTCFFNKSTFPAFLYLTNGRGSMQAFPSPSLVSNGDELLSINLKFVISSMT